MQATRSVFPAAVRRRWGSLPRRAKARKAPTPHARATKHRAEVLPNELHCRCAQTTECLRWRSNPNIGMHRPARGSEDAATSATRPYSKTRREVDGIRRAVRRGGRYPLRAVRRRVAPWAGGPTLVRRDGPYGPFWGCRNYRRNSDFVCAHTENYITLPTATKRRGSSSGSLNPRKRNLIGAGPHGRRVLRGDTLDRGEKAPEGWMPRASRGARQT